MTTKRKRNLFAELKQGIEEINAYKTGKITLRTHVMEKKLRPRECHLNYVNSRFKLPELL